MTGPGSHLPDLLEATKTLVSIPSVSHHESALADHLEDVLRSNRALEVTRIDDNLVARTMLSRSQRLLLAGHLDTVLPAGNDEAIVRGDELWGIGSADMKGGLAVLAWLASLTSDPPVDLTFVFYACEEVEHAHNGLGVIQRLRPELLVADAAVLAEPTSAVVEAGCQGTLRIALTLAGKRAHTARPWEGVNALHRLAPVLGRLAEAECREVVIDGCRYRESLQAVGLSAGVGGNVVPDSARLVVNYRFAPDRSPEEAVEHVRGLLGSGLSGEDSFEILDAASAAMPSLGHPLLEALVSATGEPPRAKLGWTDVARFAALGVPATNFGPGDPSLAHSPSEHVDRADLERVASVLRQLIETSSHLTGGSWRG